MGRRFTGRKQCTPFPDNSSAEILTFEGVRIEGSD